MNENSVTDALVSLSKEDGADIAYDFLLKSFGKTHKDLWGGGVEAQKECKFEFNGETITTRPDFVMTLNELNNWQEFKIEVKTKSNADLTDSERIPKSRDLFIIPKDYPYRKEIPKIAKHVVTWEDFFEYCDRHGAPLQALNSFRGEF